jgi:Asp-tRNA(Asn)/Glu-tRNA(Gln) amidotransferase A subunit family amidase
MDQHGIDLWIAPAAPGSAPAGLDSTGDPIMNLPWTQSGLPAINLPSGKSANGLPLGIQVVGRWYEDEKLLDWTADLEMVLQKG